MGSSDGVVLTIIMEPSGVNCDLAPGRELKHGRLASFVRNNDRGVLRDRLWDASYLGELTITSGNPAPAIATYRREHPQGFV